MTRSVYFQTSKFCQIRPTFPEVGVLDKPELRKKYFEGLSEEECSDRVADLASEAPYLGVLARGAARIICGDNDFLGMCQARNEFECGRRTREEAYRLWRRR